MIQNKPLERVYELRMVDTCTSIENSKTEGLPDIELEFVIGSPVVRFESVSYDDILKEEFSSNISNENIIEDINDLFRNWLLKKVLKDVEECKCIYSSDKLTDWEILK